jgi:uncharacterized protein (TIGR02266 family)
MASGKKAGDEGPYVLLRSERRRHLRREVPVLRVGGADSKGVFFGYAKTIGTGGMFLSSVNPKKVGQEFQITFRLPGDKEDIRCRCVVAWVREYSSLKDTEPGMGVRFLDLDDDTKKRIEEWTKG